MRFPTACKKTAQQVTRYAEALGKLSVLVVAVTWIVEAPRRAADAKLRHWQVISGALRQAGDGGRSLALVGLNEDGASLEAVTVTDATLEQRIRLPHSYLYAAHLDSTTMIGADLCGAVLDRAQMRNSTLQRADLRGASIDSANLFGVDLLDADLRDAVFDRVVLDSANLSVSLLEGASFYNSSMDRTLFTVDSASITEWARVRSLRGTKISNPRLASPRGAVPAGLRDSLLRVLANRGAWIVAPQFHPKPLTDTIASNPAFAYGRLLFFEHIGRTHVSTWAVWPLGREAHWLLLSAHLHSDSVLDSIAAYKRAVIAFGQRVFPFGRHAC